MSADEDRFWPKVDMTGDCWLWTAAKDHKGYGKFSVGSSHDGEGKRRNSMVSARIENQLAIDLGIPARPCAEYQAKQPDPKCWLCEGSGVFCEELCDECQKVTA